MGFNYSDNDIKNNLYKCFVGKIYKINEDDEYGDVATPEEIKKKIEYCIENKEEIMSDFYSGENDFFDY